MMSDNDEPEEEKYGLNEEMEEWDIWGNIKDIEKKHCPTVLDISSSSWLYYIIIHFRNESY